MIPLVYPWGGIINGCYASIFLFERINSSSTTFYVKIKANINTGIRYSCIINVLKLLYELYSSCYRIAIINRNKYLLLKKVRTDEIELDKNKTMAKIKEKGEKLI